MSTDATAQAPYRKLGGPLLLLAAGLWITVLSNAWRLLFRDLPNAVNGSWSRLADLHFMWVIALAWETLTVIVITGWCVFVLLMLHSRSNTAPGHAIAFFWASLGLAFLSILLTTTAIALGGEDSDWALLGGAIQSFGLGFLTAILWTAYLRRSERVRLTFVEK